jgi:hypothetical protein
MPVDYLMPCILSETVSGLQFLPLPQSVWAYEWDWESESSLVWLLLLLPWD